MWKWIKSDPLVALSLFLLGSMALIGLLSPWIAPYEPARTFEGAYSLPPFFLHGADPRFWLGTDDVGRDVFSRLMHGAQVSMLAGLSVAVLSILFGIALGAVAGWRGGWTETIILRVMDTMMALPSILLAIVVVTILGPSLVNAVIAASVTAIPGVVRLVRASIVEEKRKPYALSSRLYGASGTRIVLLDLMPNILAPILVQATLGFGDGILNVAALGFLGLGARPPMAEWGTMLADARAFIESNPWLVTAPGLCILIVILSFNILGDHMRDRFDPKLRARRMTQPDVRPLGQSGDAA
jgi:ABC-type dipeptide/oligopeptide/nickel transport system permease subunit